MNMLKYPVLYGGIKVQYRNSGRKIPYLDDYQFGFPGADSFLLTPMH
jgi:hypothetical protein